MKRLLMMIFFVSCISFVASAANDKPKENAKQTTHQVQQQTKTKLSAMKISEMNYVVPVDDDDDGGGDSGGGKKSKKKKCQNGSGSCTA